MTPTSPPRPEDELPGVIEELRRRRVGRVATAFLATAFAALEATLLVQSWIGESDLPFRVVLGAAVMGFPVAVVLAWTYDVTQGHIVKTPDDLAGSDPDAAGPGWLVWTVVAVAVGLTIRILR